jgi:hypothetical protein
VNAPRPHRSLAGLALVLTFVATGTVLLVVSAPTTGRAATLSPERLNPGIRPLLPWPQALTSTVFLPMIAQLASAPVNLWTGEYYANATLSGEPAYTTQETRIDYDWGSGGPGGLPTDYFSIRWTGDWDLEYGEYTFFIYADDGVRLWLDGDLLIDSWLPGMGDHQATRTILAAGRHALKIEYFEQTGGAAIQVRWRRTDLYPQWHGDYYNQPWVEAPKLYSQTDDAIEFDWGEGCPDYLPCDSFSIGWKATPVFATGSHRFYLYADEGYQLYIDGTKVKEGGWFDGQSGGAEDAYYDLTVSSTQYHQVTYNFHDRGGPAEARLWIVDLSLPRWTAEYYDNATLSGSPVHTREEVAVFVDWGLDAPRPGVPADHFSVRWTSQYEFHAGCYRFGLYADDGVRLWVDGELLVDQWHLGQDTYYSPITCLSTGLHDVVVEYFENTGSAEIRLWWE